MCLYISSCKARGRCGIILCIYICVFDTVCHSCIRHRSSPALTHTLSDHNLRLKRINIPHARNATWPIEKKIEAVTTYLALGNLRQVAAVTGVSYGMIKQWRIAPWWKDIELEVIASRRVASGNKLAKIIDKSLDVIDDRLENGDFVLNNKTGELIRKQVTLRDASTAANALMQRAAIIEKLNRDEKVAETAVSIQDQLASLAAEFAKFNNRSKANATDAEFTEVVEQPRESGEDADFEVEMETEQSELQEEISGAS